MAAQYTKLTNLKVTLLTLTGALTAVSAIFSGAVAAASAAITGHIAAATCTLTGAFGALSAAITAHLSAATITTTGLLTAATLKAGGATSATLSLIMAGTVALNPGSLLTLTQEEQSLTITGVAVGDIVVLCPIAAFEALLIGSARVSAANTVKVMVFNGSAGTIDGASALCNYLILRVA